MVTDVTMAPSDQQQDWMSPDEFNDWFRRLKLIDPDFNQPELSRRLEIPQPTISRWLSGARKIEHGQMLRRALRDLSAELEREQRSKRRRPTRSNPTTEGTDAG
jgi:hypothetical protein